MEQPFIYAPWMEIKVYPSDCLTQVCEEVGDIDGDVKELAFDMAKTMYSADGVGLAAPQVGKMVRMIVVDCSKNKDDLKYLVNPEIVSRHGSASAMEGCLSFPGLAIQVCRDRDIEVKAYNLEGEEISFKATGLLSACIQHEIDHLDGINFINRVSRQVRRHTMRKWDINDFLEER